MSKTTSNKNKRAKITDSSNNQNDNSKILEDPVQLFVYDLDKNITEKQLRKHFLKVGTVVDVWIPVVKRQKHSFALLTMNSRESAFRAIDQLDRSQIMKNEIGVSIVQDCIIPLTSDDALNCTQNSDDFDDDSDSDDSDSDED
ncbi:MAG: hypothetical protein EZS28_007401 [Streblomastix strix]|uniref:RRM domain-containing protein n=1 Tax=Streblomastix strix TaxID=222440 RepID=A0A5J4WR57_9EUKA|nr:MAG: hypothetical protein EZS28_007401 [Streblomastix strix]